MQSGPMPTTVVLGVGNLIRTDDGLGVHALRRLQSDPRVPRDIELIDGGTHGIELLAYLGDSSRLLLLDAINFGKPAGTLIRLANEELRSLPCGGSVHQLGVADLLATLPLVSTTPREIVLLGAQPGSTDWGTELTPPVGAALGPLVEEAIAELSRWASEALLERRDATIFAVEEVERSGNGIGPTEREV